MMLQHTTRASFSTRRCPAAFASAPAVPGGGAVPRTPQRSASSSSSVVANASPLEGVINSLTVALKNSPLNAGKKALAKAQAGDYDAAATHAKIEQYIKDNQVMVFSWSGCPFCKNAKGLLAELGADFTALELDTLADGKAIRAELAEMTDRTSVPNIYIQGQNVGGCNDGPGVMTLHKEGKLVPLLKQAGALA